jgi:heptosyltransferase-2
MARAAREPREILVFRTCGLGDFILSAPAFAMLRDRFPYARISLLTTPTSEKAVRKKVNAYAGGARAAPWIELLRPHLIDDVLPIDDAVSVAGVRAARKMLAGRKFDLVVQMMDVGLPWKRRFKKLAYIFALLGPVRQIGWRRRGATIEMGKVPLVDPYVGHHVHGPLQFTAELDPPATYSDADVRFDLRPSDAATAWAARWIAAHVEPDRRLAIVAPGALHAHKDWPLEKFADLTRRLLDRDPSLLVAVSGAPGDGPKGEALVAVAPDRILNLCGVTSIDQSTALFRHAALVVGNDGGAMHMADAVGAPTVSIVPGLEFPDSIEPWHNRERAIRLPIACAPCYSFTFCPEGHRRCMIDIPVQRVFEECSKSL